MGDVRDRGAVLLAGLDFFVGGPIQHAIRDSGFAWNVQDAITAAIRTTTEHGANVSSAHVVERFGAETESLTSEQVTARDFGWMRGCDVSVPVLPLWEGRARPPTAGTRVEPAWPRPSDARSSSSRGKLLLSQRAIA